ncbi:putative transmembrane protein [Toxoplasma gondii VAND]|uniref:Putative transmembrane protein n=1 Tax=Toxoplasma gondii VAND TaxID=933077 RepID=A0A086PQ33_TOXGO|nr:putative transmembrane protein [Toxoplasma gondii VAND]
MPGASPELEVLADEGSAGCIASAGASELRQRRGAKGETPAAEQKQFREGAKVAAAFQARQFPPLPGTESVELPRGDFFLACLLCMAGTVFVGAGWRLWTTQGAWEAFPYALLSFFCLCPGVYHFVVFVLIFLKVPGFSVRLLR